MTPNSPKQHKVVVHAAFEIVITNDDPDESRAICEKLFEDDIASKSEMFSVSIERMEAEIHPKADA